MLNGKPYRFTGLNIYNANSTNDNCWYSMGSGPILGQSLRQIGSGKEVFRAWFFQSLATKNGHRDWSAFDHTLAVAFLHGYRVVVTLANQWGDCERPNVYRDYGWYQSGYKLADPSGLVSYRDWVKEIVSRYRSVPSILAWQLMNEAEVKASDGTCPADGATVLKSWAADVSGLIKSIDRNHLVSLGTLGNGPCGTSWREYKDVNSVSTIDLCEYHDYGSPLVPMPGDPFNGLAFRLQQCNELNKPLFVGETGIIPNQAGGTFEGRAAAFDNKFRTQFTAGVVGELAWAWSALGSTLENYDIGPGDPTLQVLGRY
ncbi:MAG: cellulase family glycosylhydrolase [Actinomycetota bacterium]|nr:cellulase family glycosylhydrolase [Actinomycetota bacterium]